MVNFVFSFLLSYAPQEPSGNISLWSPPFPWKIRQIDPLSLGKSDPLCGGGMDIFCNHTINFSYLVFFDPRFEVNALKLILFKKLFSLFYLYYWMKNSQKICQQENTFWRKKSNFASPIFFSSNCENCYRVIPQANSLEFWTFEISQPVKKLCFPTD